MGTTHLYWILTGPLFAVRPLPSLCDFSHVGVLCTFINISAAATAGYASSSQLSSSKAGQAVHYAMAGGGMARPSQYSVFLSV
jgi:hypothetical protein